MRCRRTRHTHSHAHTPVLEIAAIATTLFSLCLSLAKNIESPSFSTAANTTSAVSCRRQEISKIRLQEALEGWAMAGAAADVQRLMLALCKRGYLHLVAGILKGPTLLPHCSEANFRMVAQPVRRLYLILCVQVCVRETERECTCCMSERNDAGG